MEAQVSLRPHRKNQSSHRITTCSRTGSTVPARPPQIALPAWVRSFRSVRSASRFTFFSIRGRVRFRSGAPLPGTFRPSTVTGLSFNTAKPLASWGQLLHDPHLAEGILDRALEGHGQIHLRSPSYRSRHQHKKESILSELDEAPRARISGVQNISGRMTVIELHALEHAQEDRKESVDLQRLTKPMAEEILGGYFPVLDDGYFAHVFVNGSRVVRGGRHTGAKPGRVARGPGWTGWGAEQ